VIPEYIPKMYSRLVQERGTVVLNTGNFGSGLLGPSILQGNFRLSQVPELPL